MKKKTWFRYKIILKSDETCIYYVPGSNDIAKTKSGKWTFDSISAEIKIYNENNVLIKSLKVGLIENDLLGIERNN